MKTKLLFFALFIGANLSLSAQKFYVNTGLTAGLSTGGNQLTLVSTTYNITLDTATYYNTFASSDLSLGKGFSPKIGVGYIYNNNLNFELNTGYFFGLSKEFSYKDIYNYPFGYTSSVTYSDKYYGKSLLFIPSMIIKTNNEALNYYMKLGFAFGFSKVFRDNNQQIYDAFSGPVSPFTNVKSTWVYKGNLSYGMEVAAGINYSNLEKISFFAELGLLRYSTKPKSATRETYIVNNADKLESLSAKDKEIVFVSTYTENETNPDNSSTKRLYEKYSFDMISLNFGIKWLL